MAAMALGASFAVTAAGSAKANAVADFYKNKKMTIFIGSTVGGGYNQYGRLLGRHMGRHIPGQPVFIPKNMPGAGGRRALAHIARRAPRDGTALGILVRSTFFDKLMYPKKAVDVDPTKLTWIGSANKEVGTCIAWHASGFKDLDDIKARVSTMGSSGPASSGTIFPKVLNEVAGTKMKIILGYPGSTQVHLAMERNEVTGRCGMGWDSLMARYRSWYFDKKVSLFLQIGLNKHPKLPNVPLLIDLARNDKEKQMLVLFSAPNDMGRPYFGPPEIPADRVKALQAAFMDTMKDPKFVADATKLNVALSPLSGPEVLKIVKDVWNTPKDVVKMAQAVLSSKKGLQQRKTNYRTVQVKLNKANKKGSKIYFTDQGKKVYASVSRRSKRSKVTIGGKKAKRGALKAGMECAVTYEGHKTLAKSVACK
jgi:tripartite-type tricarboxylate transporter receptor subunit TctC